MQQYYQFFICSAAIEDDPSFMGLTCILVQRVLVGKVYVFRKQILVCSAEICTFHVYKYEKYLYIDRKCSSHCLSHLVEVCSNKPVKTIPEACSYGSVF